jgi:predicted acetylornithine/succinylornithine family transaminase
MIPLSLSTSESTLLTQAEAVLMHNYAPAPLVLTHGQACTVWDASGKPYLDFTAGIAVNTLGHAHPAILQAITTQAQQLMHVSNLYATHPCIELATQLIQLGGFSKALFCNSGAEANEAAIKLARKWSKHHKHSNVTEIVVFGNAFHGRTVGALSLTPKESYQVPFAPLMPNVTVGVFNQTTDLDRLITHDTAMVMVEPIQGEGGVNVATLTFLQALRQRCDETNTILWFDEIQCGMGRTGNLFAFEGFKGVHPDGVSLAKGLGGGFPIGAILTTEKLADTFQPGDHGTTFGGNPLACAVALAVLQALTHPDFMKTVRECGGLLQAGLAQLHADFPQVITDVRGYGLMQGLAVDDAHLAMGELVVQARDRGLLLVGAGGNTVRLIPPLVVTPVEIHQALAALRSILADVST